MVRQLRAGILMADAVTPSGTKTRNRETAKPSLFACRQVVCATFRVFACSRFRGFRFSCLRVFVAVLCASIATLLLSSPAYPETIDRVLAVVAGQIITLSDVTAARDLRLETADGAADPTRAVLSKLIDRELVLAEVDRYAPPEPTAEAVDREVARVRARFASAAALDAALARSGIDEQHLRETLRQTLRIRAYMEQRFTGTDERRQALVNDWIAGLRRRGDVIDLYLPGR
jgi:hypothetical protein